VRANLVDDPRLSSRAHRGLHPLAEQPDAGGRQVLQLEHDSRHVGQLADPLGGSLEPGVGDVGAYRNITIRVSDSTTQVSLPPFSVEVVAMATGSVTVNWLAPEEQTDGSPLTDLSGYKIYWGTSPGDYPNSWRVNHPGVVTYVIENLTPGTYYLVATAFDSDGVESEYSDIVSEVVR